MAHGEIAKRVRASIPDTMTQRALAEVVGMTPDALSRSLKGERAFTSIELANIADRLKADLYWLITGEPDPHTMRMAARHNYDQSSGDRTVPGLEADTTILDYIRLAYRQAFPKADRPSRPLPCNVGEVREVLGSSFVRQFADAVERELDVDVIRVPGLSTDYSLTIAGRHVIVLVAQSNWFRSNWSLAHELGHLVLGHHAERTRNHEVEAAANAFAADLLLPRKRLRGIDWSNASLEWVARFVWEAGVSTIALLNRLDSLRIPITPDSRRGLSEPTQVLLRRHGGELEEPIRDGHFAVLADPITTRMSEAAVRRFPLALQQAHIERIGVGQITPGTLAWMLEVPEDDLRDEQPPSPQTDVGELAAALGL